MLRCTITANWRRWSEFLSRSSLVATGSQLPFLEFIFEGCPQISRLLLWDQAFPGNVMGPFISLNMMFLGDPWPRFIYFSFGNIHSPPCRIVIYPNKLWTTTRLNLGFIQPHLSTQSNGLTLAIRNVFSADANDFLPTVGPFPGNKMHTWKWVSFGITTKRSTQQPEKLAGEYVELVEIDISCLIPDPTATSTAARIAINRAFEGFQETGFIVIYGHGLSPETIARQFDLGNMYLSVNEEIKHHFHANISEGS